MGRRKKKVTQKPGSEKESVIKVPKSMVIRRGKVGQSVVGLVRDLRRVMEPNSSTKLKENKKNQLKDFLSIAPTFHVTHLQVLSRTDVGVTYRIIRSPRGPTLTFRVQAYSLMKDIAQSAKRPHSPGDEFNHSPLLVLNNFSGKESHKLLMTATFQNMFPALDVQNLKLGECRRVLLLNYSDPKSKGSSSSGGDESSSSSDDESNAEGKKRGPVIEFRHYLVTAVPTGISKPVKKLIKARVPKLGKLKDISQYMLNADALSDSEISDMEESKLVLPQEFRGRGNRASEKSAIRLKEIGPRMRLELLKVEQGAGGGAVLYHAFYNRSKAEVEKLKLKKVKQKQLKKERKEEQEANIRRKERAKEAQRDQQRRARGGGAGEGSDVEDGEFEYMGAAGAEEDDDLEDADYYRMEVGSAPAEGLFADRKKKQPKRDTMTDLGSWRNKKHVARETELKAARAAKRAEREEKEGKKKGGRKGDEGSDKPMFAKRKGGGKRPRDDGQDSKPSAKRPYMHAGKSGGKGKGKGGKKSYKGKK